MGCCIEDLRESRRSLICWPYITNITFVESCRVLQISGLEAVQVIICLLQKHSLTCIKEKKKTSHFCSKGQLNLGGQRWIWTDNTGLIWTICSCWSPRPYGAVSSSSLLIKFLSHHPLARRSGHHMCFIPSQTTLSSCFEQTNRHYTWSCLYLQSTSSQNSDLPAEKQCFRIYTKFIVSSMKQMFKLTV